MTSSSEPSSNIIIEVHCSSLGPSTIDDDLIDFLHGNIYNDEKENLKNFIHNCMIVGNNSMALLEMNSIKIANKLINLSQTVKQNVLFQGNSIHLKKYVQEDVCSPNAATPFISRFIKQQQHKHINKMNTQTLKNDIITDDARPETRISETSANINVNNDTSTKMVVYGFTSDISKSNSNSNFTNVGSTVLVPSPMSDRLTVEAHHLGLSSASFCLLLGVLTNHGPMGVDKYREIITANDKLPPTPIQTPLANISLLKKSASASSTPTINVVGDSKNETILEVQTVSKNLSPARISKEAVSGSSNEKTKASGVSPSASLFDISNIKIPLAMPKTAAMMKPVINAANAMVDTANVMTAYAMNQNLNDLQNIIMPSLNAADLASATAVANLLSPPAQYSLITTPKLLSPNSYLPPSSMFYQQQLLTQTSLPTKLQNSTKTLGMNMNNLPNLLMSNSSSSSSNTQMPMVQNNIPTPVDVSKAASAAYLNLSALQVNTGMLHTQQLRMMMSPTPLVTTPFFNNMGGSTPLANSQWWQRQSQSAQMSVYPSILATPPHPQISEQQKFYYTQSGLLIPPNNPPPHPSTLGVMSSTVPTASTTANAVLNTSSAPYTFYQQKTPPSDKSSSKNSVRNSNSVAAAAVHAVLPAALNQNRGTVVNNARHKSNAYEQQPNVHKIDLNLSRNFSQTGITYTNPHIVSDYNVRHRRRNDFINLNSSSERSTIVGGQSVSHSTPVVMITNLNEDCISCDKLFTLCGVFGDVHRVKISYHKRDTAFVQLANHRQAKHLVSSLNRIQLYGKMIHANLSRMTRVKMPKDSPTSTIMFPDAKFLTRDYTNSVNHRYTKRSGVPGAVKYQPMSIGQPSHILHMANLPRDTNAEELRSLLEGHRSKNHKSYKTDVGKSISSPRSNTSNSDGGIGNRIQGIELVNGNNKSATCQAFARCSSVDVACQILIEFHGSDFFGRDIKISFASRSHMPSDITKSHQNFSANVNNHANEESGVNDYYGNVYYDEETRNKKRFPYREKSKVNQYSNHRQIPFDRIQNTRVMQDVNYYSADRYMPYPGYQELAFTNSAPHTQIYGRNASQSYVGDASPMINNEYNGRYMMNTAVLASASMRTPAYQTYTVMDNSMHAKTVGRDISNVDNSPLNQRHQRFNDRSNPKQFVRKYNSHNNKIGCGNISDKNRNSSINQSSRMMYRIKCDNY